MTRWLTSRRLSPTDATLRDLETAMDIEAEVQTMREWPSGFAGIPGFALSIAPLIRQVAAISFDLGEL